VDKIYLIWFFLVIRANTSTIIYLIINYSDSLTHEIYDTFAVYYDIIMTPPTHAHAAAAVTPVPEQLPMERREGSCRHARTELVFAVQHICDGGGRRPSSVGRRPRCWRGESRSWLAMALQSVGANDPRRWAWATVVVIVQNLLDINFSEYKIYTALASIARQGSGGRRRSPTRLLAIA
jgi:hypothetical protein